MSFDEYMGTELKSRDDPDFLSDLREADELTGEDVLLCNKSPHMRHSPELHFLSGFPPPEGPTVRCKYCYKKMELDPSRNA